MGLTALLFDMCNVQITLKNEDSNETAIINREEIDNRIACSSNSVIEIENCAENRVQNEAKKNRSFLSKLFGR